MRFIICLVLIFSVYNCFAAYLTDLPQTLVQPDGIEFECLASGDEFHNWLHDENNFTIMQHPETGFYVYALQSGAELLPSDFIAGRTNPAAVGLQPGANAKPASFERRITEYRQMLNDLRRRVSTIGDLNNVVVFIRFADQEEFTEPFSQYENMFNAADQSSMYQYFAEVSDEQLDITSHFYPLPNGNSIVSYQSPNPRGYYLVYNAVTNPIGYQNDQQRRQREHELLQAAIQYVEPQIPPDLDLDNDDDGLVDNVCFIIKGATGAWADLLWPHMWVLYSIDVFIHGVQVWTYNFQLSQSLSSSGVGVLCHEMFHSLGAPDLYHYTSNGISPTGTWDLMCSNTNPPQHMTAWMKYKYGLWFDEIPEINSTGTYTLEPLADSPYSCYKIPSPNSSDEFFMIEYRRRTGFFETSLPGDGLIIYRIDTREDGNASGPPDELYVFRPYGDLTNNGNINQANFSADCGRTMFHDNTNPACFLQWGEPGGIFINNIGYVGDTMEFTLQTGIAAMFDSNLQSGPPSLGVQFYNNSYSTTNIELFMWDLNGDGSIDSYEENPYFLYENIGSYDVSLTILAGSETSVETMENFITVSEPTNISGDVAGVWRQIYSPYIITDNINVNPNDLLEIEAGTEIIVNNEAQIIIFGQITAAGSQQNMITFTSADQWKGIRISNSQADNIISFCKISKAMQTGLLIDNNSTVIISDNIFFENSSTLLGAAIDVNSSDNVEIIRNKIANNSTSSNTGGIGCLASSPLISNNLIINNEGGAAGAISLKNGSDPLIINNTIANNNTACGAIFIFNSDPEISNSIIMQDGDLFNILNGSVEITYSCISGGYTGSGNIDADPLFIEPSAGNGISFNGLEANWMLQPNSPAIDAGNPDPIYNDLDGSRNDMGAYGGPNALETPVGNDDDPIAVISRSDISIYPNPFNPQTNILLNLTQKDKQNPIFVGIYNIKGQLVKTLVNNEIVVNNTFVWDGKDDNDRSSSSGIYFFKLSSASTTISKKVLLLK